MRYGYVDMIAETEKILRAGNVVARVTSSCGCRRGRCPKITMSQVRAIRRGRGRQADIGQKYGISSSLVSRIKSGEIGVEAERFNRVDRRA